MPDLKALTLHNNVLHLQSLNSQDKYLQALSKLLDHLETFLKIYLNAKPLICHPLKAK